MLEAIDGRTVKLGDPLPLVMRGVVHRLEELERQSSGRQPAAATLRTTDGSFVEIHATRLELPAGERAVALTMNPPSTASLTGLRLATHGLTAAQRRVAMLVLQGRSTREIMATLHISQHTVQDHLKAIFDRTGVRSRRELVATLTH
jgi:DNA-binding CsgD family transcriptional regulator